ncbi:hypothetical protein LCGC14_2887030 [marine sediment metagenome]|uniref:Uncharacterized protein n=1 Tax=marine sediment metagenome TaxID=412755 RepID=A0A0F8XYL8_9ZZZZ
MCDCSKEVEMGNFKNQIPMPIKRRVEYIDLCIADIVAALNAANIITVASCCGHNKLKTGNIMLTDGRVITIKYKETE